MVHQILISDPCNLTGEARLNPSKTDKHRHWLHRDRFSMVQHSPLFLLLFISSSFECVCTNVRHRPGSNFDEILNVFTKVSQIFHRIWTDGLIWKINFFFLKEIFVFDISFLNHNSGHHKKDWFQTRFPTRRLRVNIMWMRIGIVCFVCIFHLFL